MKPRRTKEPAILTLAHSRWVDAIKKCDGYQYGQAMPRISEQDRQTDDRILSRHSLDSFMG